MMTETEYHCRIEWFLASGDSQSEYFLYFAPQSTFNLDV